MDAPLLRGVAAVAVAYVGKDHAASRSTVEVAVERMAVGLGQPGARYLGSAEVRWR